jgi:hypothetical protein
MSSRSRTIFHERSSRARQCACQHRMSLVTGVRTMRDTVQTASSDCLYKR